MDHVLGETQPTELAPESRTSPRIGILVVAYNAATTLASVLDRVPKSFQKAGYRLAIEHGLDIVVLLHGDGQYAPERLAEIVAPLERGDCDAVLGSRMMVRGAARCRAYRVAALASVPFERNSDGFNFDTQIIIQLVAAGKRIVEVPIPRARFIVMRQETTGLPFEVLTSSNRVPH